MSAVRSRYLVILCPDWPVTAAYRPPDTPFAVLSAGRVIACSTSARQRGVREGQRRKEAESRCRDLVVEARDLPAELRAFELVVASLEGFGVEVALRSPGWAGFATRGPTRRLGGERELARLVGEAVESVLSAPPFQLAGAPPLAEGKGFAGPGFSIGIGDGPFLATLAARVGRIVPSAESAAFLSDQPIEVLGRPELGEVLHRLGIHTLGAFAALPESEVLARFGADGAHAHELAAGRERRAPKMRGASAGYMAEISLDPPAERVEVIALIARSLAEELCTALANDARSCSLLYVEAQMTEGERLERRWSHDGPWSAPLVVERLRWQLEAWLSVPHLDGERDGDVPRGIEHLLLIAEEVSKASAEQLPLWGRAPGSDERVERVLARVQGMLGPNGVCRPFLVGGRGPAERVCLVPFGEPPPVEVKWATLPWPGRLPAPNPATVFSAPQPVELFDAEGACLGVDGHGFPSGVPTRLVNGDQVLEVAAWSGPWPVDEQWWQRSSRRRRARLQVVTGEGTGYLLALERGAWFLEGRYD